MARVVGRGRGEMIGRAQSLIRTIDLVRAGDSVNVLGGRGSGRTDFLNELGRRLADDEWTVVRVSGIASLRQHPLAALHLAGIGGSSRATSPLHETAEALRERVETANSVVVLDGWDDLDESSWGLIEAARRATRVPVVMSRLHGRGARQTPTGLQTSTFDSAYVVELGPLRFEDLERTLKGRLGGPLEAGTMSRIYAKSGGYIGLAVSLVEATAREGILVDTPDRGWTAVRDLWSPGLRSIFESYLSNLDPSARDALEIIAAVGYANVDTVRKLVDWETLELLEDRALIAIVSPDLVTVVPPLLVEFFRHQAPATRHVRLTNLITERIGSAASAAAVLAERDDRAPASDPGDDALFVRLLHERSRTRRLVAASEWESDPSPANAVRYLNALFSTHTPAVRATVEQVFDGTVDSRSDVAGTAGFIRLRASWAAYVDHDLDRSRQILRQARDPWLGAHLRALDATEATIISHLAKTPANFADLLEIPEDLPTDVLEVVIEAQMLILVSVGRVNAAARAFESLPRSARHGGTSTRVLYGIAQLGMGNYALALEELQRGFDEACGSLDIDAVRSFGAGLALCHMHSGDHVALSRLLDTILSIGNPTPFPSGTQQSLLALAAIVAVRRGHVTLGERLTDEAERVAPTDGPLPGESASWGRTQLLAFDGRPKDAARLLWEASAALWDRDARFASMVGLLAAAEIDPTPVRLETLEARLSDVGEIPNFTAHTEYIAALVRTDPDRAYASAISLEGAGRTGVALAAAQHAAEWFEERGDEDGRARARALEASIRAGHEADSYDSSRFSSVASVLSEREKEVARLAADGLSNHEIATRLVLSVRTIESHMHRLMRKLGISSRNELRFHQGIT